MRLSSVLSNSRVLVATAAILAIVVSCGQPAERDSSSVRDVYAVPANLIQNDAARTLFFSLKDILANPTATGSIPVVSVIAMIPVSANDLRRVATNFPKPASVSCNAQLICKAKVTGSALDVTINATVAGISNPILHLDSAISFTMGSPKADTVELCQAKGLVAKKFIMKENVNGLRVVVADAAANGAVSADLDIGNPDADLNCL